MAARKSNSPTSKKTSVTNSKIEYKNGKNQVAESLLQKSFQPLLSKKDGTARLTFCGVEHTLVNFGKGEEPFMRLAFSCLDETHDNPQTLALGMRYRIAKENKLGKILELMGYQFKEEIEILDDDDEFGYKKELKTDDIFDFLREKCGLVFKAKLNPATRRDKHTGETCEIKGLWDIEYQSLTPLMKDGIQLSDYMASSVSKTDFENPQIDQTTDVES